MYIHSLNKSLSVLVSGASSGGITCQDVAPLRIDAVLQTPPRTSKGVPRLIPSPKPRLRGSSLVSCSAYPCLAGMQCSLSSLSFISSQELLPEQRAPAAPVPSWIWPTITSRRSRSQRTRSRRPPDPRPSRRRLLTRTFGMLTAPSRVAAIAAY
jgi:hypothetical protein